MEKEEILKALEKESITRELLFKDKEKIDRKLIRSSNRINKLKSELHEIDKKRPNSLEEKIQYYLVTVDEAGHIPSERYNDQCAFWNSFDIHSSGYYPETGQVSLSIKLTYGNEKNLKQQLEIFKKILPFIKEQEKGWKLLAVFEHTLSEFGSYTLKVGEDKCVLKHRYDPDVKFNSLNEAFVYIQKHHWYDGKESEADEYLYEE